MYFCHNVKRINPLKRKPHPPFKKYLDVFLGKLENHLRKVSYFNKCISTDV